MAFSKKEFPMEMRILVAFALSALILMLWMPLQQRFFPPPPKPKPAAVETAPPAQAPVPAAKPAEAAKRKKATAKQPSKTPGLPPAVKQAERETETVIENELYRVVFSNRGAVVRSWTLKKYKDEKGRPLELVNGAPDATLGYPFTVWVDDEALRNKLSNALFQAQSSGQRAPAQVVFDYGDGTVSARKEFRFEHDSYVAEVTSEVQSGGNPAPHELAWRGSFGDQTVVEAYKTAALVTAGVKVERHDYGSIKTEARYSGPFIYAGIEDLFFAAIFMPPAEPGPQNAIPAARAFRSDYQPEGAQSALTLIGVGVGGQARNQMRVFVGPKAMDVLSHVYPEPGSQERLRQRQPVMTLADLLDYGWFSFIAKPLFLGLKWIHNNIVPNYGWAIVLLTVAINMALFPLKLRSMKSALKMQKLAPQIKAIQERYKKYKFNDPKKQEQNKEVMELYRQHGVNPIGSCFPMLLQIPFLYAFYQVLRISIEMRQAPWFGWVRDLSAKDPYYVLPIVMTLTMFVLQRMTPQAGTDPAQQKMFMFMPLIFGVMFMNVSSGLVLYWLVGNVVGIAQQWYINRAGLSTQAPRKPALASK